MLIRELISAVKHNLNSLTLDSYVSGEYIYKTALSISKLLIKRESDSRKLFKNTSNFTHIDCVEMEEMPLSDCVGISLQKCKKIMKSKKPIPEVFSSSYGSIIFVFNLDRSKDYIEVSPITYKSILNQEYKSKKKGYFWIENNHLVIPDSEVEVVSIFGLFSNYGEATDSCGKILDKNFPTLDYLLSSVVELTTKSLVTGKQLLPDENSNLNAAERQ